VYRLVPQEHYVTIRFSKPIAPGSLRFEDGGNFGGGYVDSWTAYASGGGSPYLLPFGDPGKSFVPQGIFNTEFKHIAIKGAVRPPFGYSGFYLENFFYPPVLSADGRTFYLWTRPLRGGANNGRPAFQSLDSYVGAMWWDYPNHLTITVTVDGTIQDESGLAMGVSKSFSYQVTGNGGASPEVPAYTSAISYGSGNIFPSAGGSPCMILEEKTRGAVINTGDMIAVSSIAASGFDGPLEVPADGAEHWAYALFQSYPGRWRVVGARIVDKAGFAAASAYETQGQALLDGWITGSDVPLLGENLPGEPVAAPVLGDAVLRDRLTTMYRQKMKAKATGYSDDLPVHVVRYRLRGHEPTEFVPKAGDPEGNKKLLIAFARVGVEPPLGDFPTGVTSEIGFGASVNRASYPSLSGAWLYVRYVTP
jgi:hypothetical protein